MLKLSYMDVIVIENYNIFLNAIILYDIYKRYKIIQLYRAGFSFIVR